MRRFFFFLLFCICIFKVYSANIKFKHLSMKDGLPQIGILSVYQDELGAMWFGTVEGLCRYNGRAMETYNLTDSIYNLPNNIIYAIQGNKKGALYIRADYNLIKYDILKNEYAVIDKELVKAIYYKDGNLWYITDNAVMYYSEQDGKTHEFAKLDSKDSKPISIYVLDGGTIWVGTEKGVKVFYSSSMNNYQTILPSERISTIYGDSKKSLWIGTDNGVFLLNKDGRIASHLNHIPHQSSLSNNQVRTIVEDGAGKIWIGTFFGLNKYDPITREWKNYTQDLDNKTKSISHSSIYSLYKDTQGTIWAGTYFGGVNYFNPETSIFNFYEASFSNPNSLSFPFIGNMTQDQYNNLWICTEGGGLNCFNLNTRQFTRHIYDGNNLESVKQYNLKSIWYNKDNDCLYIGIYNGGLCIFDIKRKTGRIIKHDPQNNNSLPNNSVTKIQGYKDDLIILTNSGLVRMNLKTEKFHPITQDEKLNESVSKHFIYTFHLDNKDNLWSSGGKVLLRVNLKNNNLKEYSHSEGKTGSIGKYRIVNICETNEGQLFFATVGSGLFKYNPTSDDFENYTSTNSSILSNYCYHVSEMPSGSFLVLHNNGFGLFDPKDPKKMMFHSSSKFPLNFSLGCSSFVTSKDEVFVGGYNGLVSFSETNLNSIKKEYNLYFDKLYVNHNLVLPFDHSGILTTTLPFCKKIDLTHKQNNIMIEFAVTDYLQNMMHNYEYKLDGFDSKWISALDNTITYTNLNAGEYTLLIREKNSNGTDESVYKELLIEIHPPFYATTIAYLLYALLLIGVITGVIFFFSWRAKMQAAIEIGRREKEQIEELNQIKFRFFTSISHELRTPLTLIIGQAEAIMQDSDIGSKAHNRVSRIYKNAKHMLNLISELLDFRKQEQGFAKIKVQQVDLVDYVSNIFESFQDYASKQNIKYSFEYSEEPIIAYIDTTQFQKAIYNLLSNAFKYTNKNGEIKVRLQQSQANINILVEDNGIGIPSDALTKIFERFYQIEYRAAGLSLGTGIGLALTKEIITAHKGEINVESRLEKGSIFKITLQKGGSHFSETELSKQCVEKYDILPSFTDSENSVDEYENPISTSDEELESETRVNRILIVEDNEELLEMLSDIFTPIYKVYLARNGKEGLEVALEKHPDIILSDIMMPEMDGKEMCFKIKNNINISHIPVVLLTSQNTVSQTIDGYKFGADDYITKPFNVNMLISRCNNLVRNRRLLYQSYTKQVVDTPKTMDATAERDKILLDKATKIIKENFDNPDFDMNKLALDLGINRNKLYSKIKDITGLTPNDFTLNLKLHEAIFLLDNSPHLNVSEIAYQLGFSSAKYFSKCFKIFYGIAPAQWRKRKEE